jgi:hypothetical protein
MAAKQPRRSGKKTFQFWSQSKKGNLFNQFNLPFRDRKMV